MLAMLFALTAQQVAAAAEPYGKQFIEAQASWPDEVFVPPTPGEAPPRDELLPMIDALREQATNAEYESGPYAPALAETLGDLARLLDMAGQEGEAMAVRERALHLLRVNEGLYAPTQGPILNAMLAALRRNGDFESLDQRYEYFFRLYGAGRAPWDGLRWAATVEYLRWKREALRRSVGPDRDRELLALNDLHEDLLEQFMEQGGSETWPLVRDVTHSQLLLFYLIEDMVQPLPDTFQQRGQVRRTRDPQEIDIWNERLQTLRRTLRSRGKALLTALLERIPPSEKRARAEVQLAIADWLQWYGVSREAQSTYQALWTSLQENDLADLATRWFSTPTPLPDNGAFYQPDRAIVATVPVSVSINDRGRARASTGDLPQSLRGAATRLRRYINVTRFRPAMVAGIPVAAELDAVDFVLYQR